VPWFLPAGRAGLAPESLDEEAEEEPKPGRALPENSANIVSSPPWANEPPTADLGIPPWESGPWPSRRPADPAAEASQNGAGGTSGPDTGTARAVASANGAASNGSGVAADRPVTGGPAAGGPALARGAGLRPGAASGVRQPGEIANPFAMPALIAGIAGVLVLPGLILGALGVRNGQRTRAGLVRSWLGIGLSVLWAVAIIVVVTLPGSSASADPGCTAYQASARGPVARAAAQLASGAPASQLRPSLSQAAASANGAAAQAHGVAVRATLAAMTGDLQSTLSEVTAGRQVPRLLRKDLTSDIAAAGHACG
jgi:hypothetical protein